MKVVDSFHYALLGGDSTSTSSLASRMFISVLKFVKFVKLFAPVYSRYKILLFSSTWVKRRRNNRLNTGCFRAVENILSASAGKYCVGYENSLADCCLARQVFNTRRFHVVLRRYPIILRIDQPDCLPGLSNK